MSHRLAKLLASRGAAPDVADDVVQEVAARVLAHAIAFDDALDLMRWAVPVALNLLVDNARAARRVTPSPDEHDQPVADIADVVVHRDRLFRVLHAIPLLSAADRAALSAPADTPADRREAVKLAVRRHRARRRLLALVDGVAAFGTMVVAWLRRSRTGAATATVAFAAAPVAFFVLAPAVPSGESAQGAAIETTADSDPVRISWAARRTDLTPARARQAPPRRATAVRPPAPPSGREVVRAETPDAKVKVTERQPNPDDGLVCIRRVPVLPDFCVGPQRPQIDR